MPSRFMVSWAARAEGTTVVPAASTSSLVSLAFYLQLLQLACALWLRMYVHYLGQYALLRALRVPVYDFSPLVYSMTLKYIPDALPPEVEMYVVLVGPCAALAAFGALCALSWAGPRALGFVPDTLARFVAFFGVATVLDSVLIALVDAAAGRYDCAARVPDTCGALGAGAVACQCSEGDAWRLYRRFDQEGGGGAIGAVLTVLMYAGVAVLALLALYLYVLLLHLGGRMVDTFRRLQAREESFRVPGDFELSAGELRALLARARKWRGPKGQLRRLAVVEVETPLGAARAVPPLGARWKTLCRKRAMGAS